MMKYTLRSKNLPLVATGIPTPFCNPKTKTTSSLKGFLTLVVMVLGMQMGWGQLLNENFSYTVGTNLTANGWTVTGTTATPNVTVSAASITYPGYLSSGIGEGVSLATSGQDVNRTFTSQTTGTIYVSFLVNVTTANTAGDYFFNLGATTIGTNLKGKVFVKRDASSNVSFGIGQASTPNYSSAIYALNTTYIIVLKYDIVSGTGNDVASIYVNPQLNSAIPSSGWVTNTDVSATDVAIGSVGLRQGTAANAAALLLDGIRVSTVWSDIVGSASTAPTVTNTTPATNITTTSATLAGNVTATGGASISANGSVYSLTATNAAPQISGTGVTQLATTSPSTSTGVFSNNSIATLSVNTQYSFNAYATNSVGTSYGTVSTFYTLANVPSAPTVSNATANSMTIALNENGNPATTQYAIQEAGGLYVQNNGTLGTFALWKTAGLWGAITVSGLSANTNYTFKVKAKNGENVETGFSGTTSLSTLAGSSPVANITGPVAEESLNTYGLQLTLTNDTFSSTPTSTDFTLNNAPSGVTIGSVTYNSSSSVTLNLLYNGDFDANVTTFSVTIASTVLTSAAALTTNAITLTALTESLSVGSVTGFGNQTVNTTSAEKSFTVLGTVRSTVSLVPPTGYEISTGTGGSFVATNPINLTPTGTSLSSTTIYVRFKPTTVASYSGNITGSATAVSTATVALTGTGIAPANPTVFSGTTASNSQINLAATANGNSNNIIVVFNATGTFASPTNGVTAGVQGDTFAGGTIWFNGAAGSITNHTGLNAATTYYYKAFSYDSLNFYSAGATATATTVKAEPSAQATSLAFSTITTSSFTTAFSSAAGTPDGYLVIRSANSTLSANPVDGTVYTTSSSVGGGSVVSVGSTITGIANTSLSSGTTYYTFVFAYNNSGATIDYLTTNPLTASTITLCAAPAPSASNVSAISFDISWTAITGAASYQLDVTTDAGFTAFVSGYNSLSVAGTSQALSGLLSNTPYYFRVRAVNASGNSAYGTGSQTTSVLTTPIATAATSIGSTSFTANWGAVTGATGYLLDVATTNTFGSTIISENFSGFTTNNGSAERSATLDNYLNTIGWTGAVIYEMVGYTKMGGGSSRGIITTPTLNLSVNGGISTLTFDLSKYGSDATSVQVFHAADGANFVQVGLDIAAPTSMTTQSVSISGGTTSSKIRIQAKNISSYRFYLDNIIISYSTILPAYNAKPISGQASVSSSVTGLTSGTTYYYRVRATDGSVSANSNVIMVSPQTVGGTISSDQTICSGSQPASLTLSSNVGTVVKWQSASDAAFTTPSDLSYTTTSLTGANIGNLSATTYFRAVVQSGTNPSEYSSYVTITVNASSVGGSVTGGTTICSGDTSGLLTLGSQTGTILRWESSISPFNIWSSISNTSATYTSGVLSQTTQFRAVVQSGVCTFSNSNTTTVTVNPTLTPSVATAASPTGAICIGTSVTFTATPTNGGTSPSYQWKVNGSNVGTDSATFTTTTLVNNDVVTVEMTSNATPCLSSAIATSNSISIVVQNKWLVTASSLWSDSSNWTCGVPSSTDNIVIDSGSPVLDTDFTIGSSGSLTISGTGTLTINSTKTLTITGTANFGGKSVTIKSDLNGTGAIGEVTGTLSNATNVTVERYIPAKRAWRALTAPLKGSDTSIFSQWQNNGTVTAGTGVELWGPGGTGSGSTNNGLEVGSNNSILQYDNSSAGAWAAVTDTKTTNLFTTNANNAFMIFPTGGYGSGYISSSVPATETTLKATGQLITGDVPYSSLPNTSHTLIGNPYASPIDLNSILDANTTLEKFFWVWDPKGANQGTYNTFDAAANTYTFTNVSYSNSTVIQSGQAFFVKALTGQTGSFTISESNKSTGSSNAVFRTAAPELLRVGLYKQVNNEWSGRDGAMTVILPDADANQTPNKMANGTENVAFTKNDLLFASEHHLPLVASDVLNVKVWNTTAGTNYKLKINTEQFNTTNLNATLEDLFTNSRTSIALDGTAVEYPFAVTTEAASTGNRFRIVFENSALGLINPKATGISILPNPITGDAFQVYLGTLSTGTYSYSISNALGQEVENGSINNVTQNSNYTVKFKNNTAAGMYIMKVTGTDNSVFTAKIIKQ